MRASKEVVIGAARSLTSSEGTLKGNRLMPISEKDNAWDQSYYHFTIVIYYSGVVLTRTLTKVRLKCRKLRPSSVY